MVVSCFSFDRGSRQPYCFVVACTPMDRTDSGAFVAYQYYLVYRQYFVDRTGLWRSISLHLKPESAARIYEYAHDSLPALVSENHLVLFDNVCHLCSASVQFILRHNTDQSIKFASIQSEVGHQILRFYGFDTDTYETMLYLEDGQLYTRSTAVLKITKHLAWPWRFVQVLCIIPKDIRDWFYDRIARNRYKLFGKRDRCYIPDAKMLSRFLD